MKAENSSNLNDDVVGMFLKYQKTRTGFDAIYSRISPTLDGMVRQLLRKRFVKSPDAAAEVMQMIMVDLLEVPDKGPTAWFDPKKCQRTGVDGLNGWLYGFANNAVNRYCGKWHGARKGTKVIAEAALPLNELGESKSIVKSAVAKIEAGDPEVREIMNACLDALPKQFRGLLRMQMLDELPVRALSKRTGIHVSTVQRRLTKAKHLLREALAARGIDADWFLPA